MAKYKIKSSLIQRSWFESVIHKTLDMYENGEDLVNCPLNEFQRNYMTWGGRHRDLTNVADFESALMVRLKNFIQLYEDIKKNGYDESKEPLFVYFDDDGFINLYDGHHRLSIIRYLGIDPEMWVSTDWDSKGIDPSGIIGKDFPLVEKLTSRFDGRHYMYNWVEDPRLSDFTCQRPDGPERLRFILDNMVGSTVLDIGCSEGYFSHQLAKAGYKPTAVDILPMLVSVARYLATIKNVKVKCITGDWKEVIREQKTSFDNVLYLSVLHNEVNAIGEQKAFDNLKLFRGKVKRLFIEVPDIKIQKDWAFAFDLMKLLPRLERETGMKVEKVFEGYRPIILLTSKIL